MKVAIVTESDIDEAAIRILVGAVLGIPALPVDRAGLRTRSWPGILHIIKPVFLDLYYQSDADGLVLVVDSNSSPVHETQHDEPGKQDKGCRLCQMRGIIAGLKQHLKPRPHSTAFHTAIGLTVPEIAAWYRHGVGSGVNESAWINGLKLKKLPYTKQKLKKDAFGKAYLPRDEAIEIARAHATRLGQNLTSFEKAFPIGFGSLAADLRAWKQPDANQQIP